jgi:hypothetical protein
MCINELPHESQVNVNLLSQKSFQTLLLLYKPMWPKACDYIQNFKVCYVWIFKVAIPTPTPNL